MIAPNKKAWTPQHRVSPYLNPIQRAMIYKSMVRFKMEDGSSVWMAASETSLSRLDAIQMGAVQNCSSARGMKAIQPLAQRRQVGALTLFHQIYHKDAPTLLNSVLPPPPVVRVATRASTYRHTAAVAIPP